MKILNFAQGTDEWKAARAKYFTASESSIMMACSKNVSRNDLLKMKALGTDQEFSAWFEKNILDKGHQVEALARPIAEQIIGEDLFPVTGVDEETNLLASFDGLTMMGDVCWECKQYNADKAADVDSGKVPDCDFWQVVQQMLVSGAGKCLYMVTDGTEENTRHVWVYSNNSVVERLIAGWKQFADDLDNYEHKEAKPEAVAEKPADLPALVVDLVGEVRSSNLATVKDVILARIQAVNTDLKTDQDFADAEATVKFFTKGEKQLEDVKTQALAQTSTIDELFNTVDLLKNEMRTKRLLLNKVVKDQKESVRVGIILSAKRALTDHISSIERALSGYRLPETSADFAAAIKGKKTIASLQSAADDELAKAKIEANQFADDLRSNIKLFNELTSEYEFLFSDKQRLMAFDSDHLTAEIKSRIADHKEIERVRAEQERERIRQEEQEKIRRQQEQEDRDRQAEQARAAKEAQAASEKIAASTEIPTEPEQQQRFIQPTGRNPQPVVEAPLLRPAEAVSIPAEEYAQLQADSALLAALVAAGVDSWDGYDHAIKMIGGV